MNTIVLSAFGPFGDYLANSSEIVARILDRQVLGGHRVSSMVFPASIPTEGDDRGATLLYAACSMRAVGIISLGMASEKKGLCVEAAAVNKVSNEKYCPPELNGTPIDHWRPYGEKVYAPLDAWDTTDLIHSEDAGGFCCNHLSYQTVKARPSSHHWMRIPSIFVHVPCSPEAVADPLAFLATRKTLMTIEGIIAGLDLLVSKARLI